MATVRITSNIRNHVWNEINKLFADRIEKRKQDLQQLGIGTACYNKYIKAEFRERALRLNCDPDGHWIDLCHHLPVHICYETADGNVRDMTFLVSLEPPVAVPLRMRRPTWDLSGALALTPDMAPYAATKQIFLDIDQLAAERDSLHKNIVNGVLEQCSTLRQVLEVWPTAMDFMPDYARDQHNAKTPKRTSRDIAAEIQIDDSVKVSLMKARMTKGT